MRQRDKDGSSKWTETEGDRRKTTGETETPVARPWRAATIGTLEYSGARSPGVSDQGSIWKKNNGLGDCHSVLSTRLKQGEPSSFLLLTRQKILQGQTMAHRSWLFRLPYSKNNMQTYFLYWQRDNPLKLFDLIFFNVLLIIFNIKGN